MADNDKRMHDNSMTLTKPNLGAVIAVTAIFYGVVIALFENFFIGPEYDLDDLILFLLMYGWMVVWVFLGIRNFSKCRQFFVVSTLPIAIIAIAFTVLSWPIYMPSAALMFLAIITAKP